jgi:hypothetical protein
MFIHFVRKKFAPRQLLLWMTVIFPLEHLHWAKYIEASAMSSIGIRLFTRTILSTASTLFSVLDVDGLLGLSSPHTEVIPFLK